MNKRRFLKVTDRHTDIHMSIPIDQITLIRESSAEEKSYAVVHYLKYKMDYSIFCKESFDDIMDGLYTFCV